MVELNIYDVEKQHSQHNDGKPIFQFCNIAKVAFLNQELNTKNLICEINFSELNIKDSTQLNNLIFDLLKAIAPYSNIKMVIQHNCGTNLINISNKEHIVFCVK